MKVLAIAGTAKKKGRVSSMCRRILNGVKDNGYETEVVSSSVRWWMKSVGVLLAAGRAQTSEVPPPSESDLLISLARGWEIHIIVKCDEKLASLSDDTAASRLQPGDQSPSRG